MKVELRALGDLAEFINGVAFRPEDWGEEGVPIVRIQNLTDPTKPYNRTLRRVDRKYSVCRGDLLVSWSASLGVFVWDQEQPALVNQHIFKVVPKSDVVDRNYLRHSLEIALVEMASHLHGATMQHVNRAEFLGTRVAIPELQEQRRIAAILDQAEALRAKRRQALAKIDTLTQSLFLEMFGDPLQESSRWPTQRIDSLCKLVRGSSPRPQGDPRFYGGRIPRLMVADLTRDGWLVHPRIDSLTPAGAALSRPVPAGTVVMAVSGNVGLVSMLAVDACIHDGFVGLTQLTESRVEPRYLVTLLYLLKVTHEQRKAGAIFQNLTTSDVKAMQVPVPSIELQRTFVRRLELLDKLTDSAKQSRGEIERLFASVQHRAFRGEL